MNGVEHKVQATSSTSRAGGQTGAQRIALFGGTFDPPHVGHLTMAQLTLEAGVVDAVWFLPAPVPPHKVAAGWTAYDVRLKMVEALIRDMRGMFVHTLESRLSTPSYTTQTVQAYQAYYTEHQFYFLLGSDSLAQLPSWYDAADLANRIEFLVATRHGYPFGEALLGAQRSLPMLTARQLEMPLLDVSSTWIRERMETGRPVCGLVPNDVLTVWTRMRRGESAGGDAVDRTESGPR